MNNFLKACKKHLNGQSSIEFIILVMATFVIFLSFVYLYGNKVSIISKRRTYDKVHWLCNYVRDEIDTAAMVHDGYYRNFKLPNKIYGSDYQISELRHENKVIITISCRNITYLIDVPYYEGSLVKGENTIKKIDGKIYLNL